MFPTDTLSIIRGLITVFTAIGIFRTSYIDCLLVKQIPIAVNTVLILLMMDSKSVRNM